MAGDPFAYRRKFGQQDRLRMATLYREGLSSAEIGKQFGCSAPTIRRYLYDMGVEMRPAFRRSKT